MATATGNPAAYTSQNTKAITGLTIPFTAVQSGTGDPSPSNVRSISGFSTVNIHRAGKNMAYVNGYSAYTSNQGQSYSLTNNYGTTINTTDPESSVTVTQSSSTTDYDKHNYRNGYVTVQIGPLTYGQAYDVSFKVTDITSNPLSATLVDMAIYGPSGSGVYIPTVVGENVVIFKNLTYLAHPTYVRHSIEIRNCGMSFTVSEFMITPANTSDGAYVAYTSNPANIPVVFPLGKNLINQRLMQSGYISSSGGFTNSSTDAVTDFIVLLPNTSYVISANQTMSNIGYYIWDETISTKLDRKNNQNKQTVLIESANVTRYIRVWFNNEQTVTPEVIAQYQPQLEVGTTATTYEAYATCYGGSLNALTGVLTATHGYTLLSALTWIDSNQTNVFRGQGLSNTPTENTFELVCSSYKVNNVPYGSMSDKQISSRASFNYHELMIKDTGYSSANDLSASFDSDDVLVYELATPYTVQCDAVTINSLLGANTIWTDTNGTNSITYPEGPDVTFSKIIYKSSPSAEPVVLMDTTQKTVTTGTMLSGVTALKNDGSSITGTLPSKSSTDVTVSGRTVTIPAGNYSSDISKSVPAAPAFAVAKSADTSGGTLANIIGVDISSDTVTAAHLCQGYTAHDASGNAITGTYGPTAIKYVYSDVDGDGAYNTSGFAKLSRDYAPVKDGKSRLWIKLTDDLNISVAINSYNTTGTIIWGDGTSEEFSASGTKTHTYSSAGRYVIECYPTSGNMYFDFNTCVVGQTTSTTDTKLYGIEYYAYYYATVRMNLCINCVNLKRASITGSTSTSFNASVFQGCTSLEKAEIPSTITSLGSSDFRYCTSLKEIIIPNSVTTIEGSVFYNCTALEEITFPSSVTSIGAYVCESCTSLHDVYMLPTTPPTIGIAGFLYCSSSLVIHVPNGSLSAYQSATNWSIYASKMVEEEA